MFFLKRKNSTRTRANDVRPLDAETRSYCLHLAVILTVLGLVPWLPSALPFLFRKHERLVDSAYLLIGAALLAFGVFHFLIYGLDCLSRLALGGMTRAQLKKRLARAEKAYASTAGPVQVRVAAAAARVSVLLLLAALLVLIARR